MGCKRFSITGDSHSLQLEKNSGWIIFWSDHGYVDCKTYIRGHPCIWQILSISRLPVSFPFGSFPPCKESNHLCF